MSPKKKKGGCYLCGSIDHRANACAKSTCHRCGGRGHTAGGCPERPLPPLDLGCFAAAARLQPIGATATVTGFTYIELFAGMGGFRVALDRLGGRCVFASEVDRFCVRNYQCNFGDRPAGDICRIDSVPDHNLLVGGFPCQPFSTSSGERRVGLKDPKGQLFREVVRILSAKRPKAFLLENVRGLLLHDSGRTFEVVKNELESCGYQVSHGLVDAAGILPQERCRLYIVGIHGDSCKGRSFVFPKMPELKRGVRDILHSEESPDELTMEAKVRLCLSNRQEVKVQSQTYTKEHTEARFLSDTSKPSKTIQASYTKYMVGSQFVPVSWNPSEDPPPTSSNWRRFSSREVARLQGFPESFQLCHERAYHMIGNAVAPPVIAMIAASLLQMLEGLELDTDPDWGWKIAQEMLLDAAPNDARKARFITTLGTYNRRNSPTVLHCCKELS